MSDQTITDQDQDMVRADARPPERPGITVAPCAPLDRPLPVGYRAPHRPVAGRRTSLVTGLPMWLLRPTWQACRAWVLTVAVVLGAGVAWHLLLLVVR